MYLVCSPFINYERGEKMSKFEGLTDSQWSFLAPLVSQEPEKRSKGYPHASWRKVCHSIFWILITGSRWCDLPKGEAWGARTTSHSRLGVLARGRDFGCYTKCRIILGRIEKLIQLGTNSR